METPTMTEHVTLRCVIRDTFQGIHKLNCRYEMLDPDENVVFRDTTAVAWLEQIADVYSIQIKLNDRYGKGNWTVTFDDMWGGMNGE